MTAEETVNTAKKLGFTANISSDFVAAVKNIEAVDPTARILICGSLYLAGKVLQENS